MPKIFEYLGIIIMFYSNEHEPIHAHGQQGEFESKAEFLIENGEIVEIKIKPVKGKKPLKGKDLKNLKAFLQVYGEQWYKNGCTILFTTKRFNLKKLLKSYENYGRIFGRIQG